MKILEASIDGFELLNNSQHHITRDYVEALRFNKTVKDKLLTLLDLHDSFNRIIDKSSGINDVMSDRVMSKVSMIKNAILASLDNLLAEIKEIYEISTDDFNQYSDKLKKFRVDYESEETDDMQLSDWSYCLNELLSAVLFDVVLEYDFEAQQPLHHD